VNLREQTTQALEKALFLSYLTLHRSNLSIDSFTQLQDLTICNSSTLFEVPLNSFEITGNSTLSGAGHLSTFFPFFAIPDGPLNYHS
jgi:hypothetical protein